MTSCSMRDVKEFKRRLTTNFLIKDLGEVEYYTECHVKQDRVNRTLTVDQWVHIKTIMDRFDVVKKSDSLASFGMRFSNQKKRRAG